MKINIEISSRPLRILVATVLVLAAAVLVKSLFPVQEVVANGFYQGPTAKYFTQHLDKYPDMHLFRRVGKKIECVGVCKVDEKNNTYKWVEIKSN